jgi:hypothetical protein
MILDNRPDHLKIKPKIFVSQDVSETNDAFPADVWVGAFQFGIAKVLEALANDFKVA